MKIEGLGSRINPAIVDGEISVTLCSVQNFLYHLLQIFGLLDSPMFKMFASLPNILIYLYLKY